jgi:hypothetical protein
MKKTGFVATMLIMMALIMMAPLLLHSTFAQAATDGVYSLAETSRAWDATDANRTRPPTSDYDYTYGDEASLVYALPWPFTFYGQSYSQINADTNGNIWFTATGSAHSLNLANSGRGPVIAVWNNDLSSYFYGGVFIQHKSNPERVIIEWQTETYSDEGAFRVNRFAAVLFPNGVIRTDYAAFDSSTGKDFGSGISRGDGTSSVNLTSTYGNAFSLSGRSFLFASGRAAYLEGVPGSFGTVATGTSSQRLSIVVSNAGTENLRINAVNLNGNYPGSFSLVPGGDGCSGATLAPSQSCTVQVVFFPLILGPQSAVVAISSNDATTPLLDVILDGTGLHPILTLSTLADGAVTNTATLNLAGSVNGSSSEVKSLTVNGQTAMVNPDGSFSVAVHLTDGANTISTVATDKADNETTDTRTIILDQAAPKLTVTSPADNSKTSSPFTVLSGMVDENSTVTQKVNGGTPQAVAMTGTVFNSTVYLSSGFNTIDITATDLAGNSSSQKRTAIYDRDKPALAITDPAQDFTTSLNRITIKGSVTDALTAVTMRVSFEGQTFTPPVTDDAFALPITFNSERTYPVIVTATDEVGNSTTVQRNIIYAIPLNADLADALKALQVATGIAQPTAAELARADMAPIVNGVPQPDGIIDIQDVIVILRRLVGLPL